MQEIKNIVHVELTVWLVSKVEVFVNYNIYKFMRGFCEKNGKIFPDSFLSSRLIMIRVLGALLLKDEYERECKEALERCQEHRIGKV